MARSPMTVSRALAAARTTGWSSAISDQAVNFVSKGFLDRHGGTVDSRRADCRPPTY
jgi:hypothetical protein